MSLWESLFAHLQQPVAQVLLTRNDIADVRYPLPDFDAQGSADEVTADTIPKCSEHIHGTAEYGRHSNRQ